MSTKCKIYSLQQFSNLWKKIFDPPSHIYPDKRRCNRKENYRSWLPQLPRQIRLYEILLTIISNSVDCDTILLTVISIPSQTRQIHLKHFLFPVGLSRYRRTFFLHCQRNKACPHSANIDVPTQSNITKTLRQYLISRHYIIHVYNVNRKWSQSPSPSSERWKEARKDSLTGRK